MRHFVIIILSLALCTGCGKNNQISYTENPNVESFDINSNFTSENKYSFDMDKNSISEFDIVFKKAEFNGIKYTFAYFTDNKNKLADFTCLEDKQLNALNIKSYSKDASIDSTDQNWGLKLYSGQYNNEIDIGANSNGQVLGLYDKGIVYLAFRVRDDYSSVDWNYGWVELSLENESLNIKKIAYHKIKNHAIKVGEI
jgi:uncharacterized protein YcfL